MPRPATLLAPSLLGSDHANLAQSARTIQSCGLTWAHLDIMDGHFVPNLSFGPQTLRDLREQVDLFYDTHLMLDQPHLYVDAFIEAGAGLISIHVEPDYPIDDTLDRITRQGVKAGIVLNPGTAAPEADRFLDRVDLVLIMTVQPGYGGQAFRHDMLPKIEALAERRDHLQLGFRLEVDGGIDAATGRLCREAGADTLVAGTAFFKAPEPREFVGALLG